MKHIDLRTSSLLGDHDASVFERGNYSDRYSWVGLECSDRCIWHIEEGIWRGNGSRCERTCLALGIAAYGMICFWLD